jgi:hypothetical protein
LAQRLSVLARRALQPRRFCLVTTFSGKKTKLQQVEKHQ